MEKKVEVRTFAVHYVCDEEGCDGKVVATGFTIDTYPQQYSHQCNKCGKTYYFECQYPRIIHKRSDEIK